uniref:Uncharacterized protein n=1 Tax=Physcomitrium patens TaxID=3218 RepID=A0A2K1KQK2_PHYPA|nr:hypothetical protein PHYPA_006933 [Physcomitrium patens]
MSTRVPPPGRLKNLQVMAITRGGLIAGASSDARVDSLLGTTIEVPFVPHMWVPSWERAVRVYRRHGAFRWLWRRGMSLLWPRGDAGLTRLQQQFQSGQAQALQVGSGFLFSGAAQKMITRVKPRTQDQMLQGLKLSDRHLVQLLGSN